MEQKHLRCLNELSKQDLRNEGLEAILVGVETKEDYDDGEPFTSEEAHQLALKLVEEERVDGNIVNAYTFGFKTIVQKVPNFHTSKIGYSVPEKIETVHISLYKLIRTRHQKRGRTLSTKQFAETFKYMLFENEDVKYWSNYLD